MTRNQSRTASKHISSKRKRAEIKVIDVVPVQVQNRRGNMQYQEKEVRVSIATSSAKAGSKSPLKRSRPLSTSPGRMDPGSDNEGHTKKKEKRKTKVDVLKAIVH
jgi:hypothetical protein